MLRILFVNSVTAQSVLEVRTLKLAIQQRRQEQSPKDLRSWVADRANEGDARAAAQLRGCGRRQHDFLTTKLCECGLDWRPEFINGCEVGHHHTKCLGLIYAAENLPADSLQLIGDLVGQRKDERSVDTLKWNVQPLVVVESKKLRLSGFALEIHDDVFSQCVFLPDFEHRKELIEMALCESGIDGKPELSALFCGSNDSALRSGCGLRLRSHVVVLI